VEHVHRTLNEYITREFMADRPGETLANDDRLFEDNIIDSLGIFVLVAYIEQEFGVKLQPEDVVLDNFATVNAIGDLVTSRLSVNSEIQA
jgi:acyl carrier protein